MLKLLTKLKTNDSGATAIEYGLIAALVSVVVITAFGLFGDGLSDVFTNIGSALTDSSDDIAAPGT